MVGIPVVFLIVAWTRALLLPEYADSFVLSSKSSLLDCRKRCFLFFSSSNDGSTNNDEEEKGFQAPSNPRAFLREAWKDNFELDTEARFVDPKENKVTNYKSPYEIQQYLQEKQQIIQDQEDQQARQPQSSKSDQTNINSPDTGGGEEEDGVQLDSDEYLRLSQSVGDQDPFQEDRGHGDAYSSVLNQAFTKQQQKTGSNRPKKYDESRYRSVVQNLAKPNPFSPNVAETDTEQASLNDLLNVWREASDTKNVTSEELHRQVFEEEEGFLKQSSLFRESLSNSSKTREAIAKRHSAAYDARQARAQMKLQQQVEDLQAILQSAQQHKCPACECIMSEETWEKSKQMYRGKEICDICYAEKALIKPRAGELPPSQWQSSSKYMDQQSPGRYSSSTIRRTGAGPSPAFRPRVIDSQAIRRRRAEQSTPYKPSQPQNIDPSSFSSRVKSDRAGSPSSSFIQNAAQKAQNVKQSQTSKLGGSTEKPNSGGLTELANLGNLRKGAEAQVVQEMGPTKRAENSGNGWVRMRDPKTGRYFQKQTKKSQ